MPPPAAAADRLVFFDRLRVALTALVLFHHAAITYGAEGGWYLREIQPSDAPQSLLLSFFCGVNQAYFMGLFFLIAGYFAVPALARRGAAGFLAERALRLGLPLAVYGFVLGPFTYALALTAQGKPLLATWGGLMSHGLFLNGPLWFAQALLIFSAALALWRRWRPAAPASDHAPLPGTARLLAVAFLVGAAALLIRQWVPTGTEVFGLQLGYFASYVALFAAGCAAAQHRWLERVERNTALPLLRVAAVALPLLPAVVLGSAALGTPPIVATGFSLPAIVYAFWEPLVAWGLIALLLWQFRLRFNGPSRAADWLGRRAYAVYVIHPPLLVALTLLLASWSAPALVKFFLVGALGCVASWLVAGLLLRLPGVARVL
jgi:fucose 4-O-acetylase-like acetyltransferase